MDADTIDDYSLSSQSYEHMMTSEQIAHEMMEKASCLSNTKELLSCLKFADRETLGGSHWRWFLAKAFILWKLGRNEELLRVLNQRKELDLDPQTWILRGMAWKSFPDCLDKSRQSYMKAIELDPNCSDAHYNLANSLSSSDFDLALQHYFASLKLDSLHASCWFNLALLLLNDDRLDTP